MVTDQEFAKQALASFPDLLTAGIDAKNGEVAVAGWREGAGVPAEELIAEVENLALSIWFIPISLVTVSERE